jgi:hypothetical protein
VKYDNRFCSIIKIESRKIAHWRDYKEGDAKGFRHLCLALAGLQASGTQPRADVLIDNAGLSWHVGNTFR